MRVRLKHPSRTFLTATQQVYTYEKPRCAVNKCWCFPGAPYGLNTKSAKTHSPGELERRAWRFCAQIVAFGHLRAPSARQTRRGTRKMQLVGWRRVFPRHPHCTVSFSSRSKLSSNVAATRSHCHTNVGPSKCRDTACGLLYPAMSLHGEVEAHQQQHKLQFWCHLRRASSSTDTEKTMPREIYGVRWHHALAWSPQGIMSDFQMKQSLRCHP